MCSYIGMRLNGISDSKYSNARCMWCGQLSTPHTYVPGAAALFDGTGVKSCIADRYGT